MSEPAVPGRPPEGPGERLVSTTVSLAGDGWQLSCRVSVPSGPTRPAALLPVARSLSDAIVASTTDALSAAGETVSCRAGCGACCRNLIAISEVEARRLREVVEGLPAERRAAVLSRFGEARQRLARAGLLGALESPERMAVEEHEELSSRYFEERIACPFLEDESCSVYAERPVTCREHLVVSPPEHCALPASEDVRRVRLPVAVFNALARWEAAPSELVEERWVPLVLALDWARAHPDDAPPRPGIDLLRALLGRLSPRRSRDREG